MTALPRGILTALLADAEAAALLDDAAQAAAMVAVEAALARVEARLGIIPAAHGEAISAALAGFEPDLADLAHGTGSAGVPVPALVAQLRRRVGPPAGDFVHWGATSQDIVDTALVLQLREILGVLDGRLNALATALAGLAEAHAATPMIGRTRFQQAVPTTFGLKAAGWLAPLLRHRRRLAELEPRLLLVQLGGAAGNLAVLGDKGVAVMEGLAEELGLGCPAMPWHSQRDGPAELASWLALVTGSLGKLGQDVLLLAQNEVGEAREAAGGGSSTMPQKSNPILSEALVTLARRNAALVGGMHEAMLHAHERDGAAWALEWAVLPEMISGTAAALVHADRLVRSLVVDPAGMRHTLDAAHGLHLAEAASFALADRHGRARAQEIVGAACRTALAEGRDLVEVLNDAAPGIDWAAVRNGAERPPAAAALIRRVLDAGRPVVQGARRSHADGRNASS
ncbi:MAG TPA: 3-carboxy-cis,cis-muconate cycloisomerase [Geminicoccaceae bacterium]|nr:3-carboxy-cis,cis-muconate cycloisomerase [Geminicoccus sp.]HMU48438.1 3-carboxy-cis,cis-muconate cycloisomerase [Geminicoccaceae bacterium]